MVENFFPRQWTFWSCYLSGWLIVTLPFAFSNTDMEQGFLQTSMFSDLARFLVTMPVLLCFRHLFIVNRWQTLAPIELISLTLGFNIVAAIVIAYIVPFSISSSDIWFDLFQRELVGTPRQFDEKFVSFLYSYILQLMWCIIYILFKSYKINIDLESKEAVISHQLKDAKIHSLSNQISPHFLFNGLNNLCSLMDEDTVKAQSVLRAFSEMLRFTMETRKHEKIPIEEELRFVDNYIKVCSIQYEDRLRFYKDVPDSTLRYCIPPMVIQLLVENAVKYGVNPNKHGGDIELRICSRDYELEIYVVNEGKLNPKNFMTRSGVGVQNISERLELLYGDRASFKLSDQENNKVVAQLVLPKEKHYENPNH